MTLLAPITLVSLVTGASAHAREAAIWSASETDSVSGQYANTTIGVILEGLPDGKSGPDPENPNLHIKRITPGCLCCVGNLTLRVTLNRLLRKHPSRLYISIADTTHLDKIHEILAAPPYDEWLTLSDDINA